MPDLPLTAPPADLRSVYDTTSIAGPRAADLLSGVERLEALQESPDPYGMDDVSLLAAKTEALGGKAYTGMVSSWTGKAALAAAHWLQEFGRVERDHMQDVAAYDTPLNFEPKITPPAPKLDLLGKAIYEDGYWQRQEARYRNLASADHEIAGRNNLEALTEDLAGIDPQYHSWLMSSTSYGQFMNRRERLAAASPEFAAKGSAVGRGVGLVGDTSAIIGMSLALEPLAWLPQAAGFARAGRAVVDLRRVERWGQMTKFSEEFALASQQVSRITGMTKYASLALVEEGVIKAARYAVDPTYDPDAGTLAFDAAFAVGIGGAIGGFIGRSYAHNQIRRHALEYVHELRSSGDLVITQRSRLAFTSEAAADQTLLGNVAPLAESLDSLADDAWRAYSATGEETIPGVLRAGAVEGEVAPQIQSAVLNVIAEVQRRGGVPNAELARTVARALFAARRQGLQGAALESQVWSTVEEFLLPAVVDTLRRVRARGGYRGFGMVDSSFDDLIRREEHIDGLFREFDEGFSSTNLVPEHQTSLILQVANEIRRRGGTVTRETIDEIVTELKVAINQGPVRRGVGGRMVADRRARLARVSEIINRRVVVGAEGAIRVPRALSGAVETFVANAAARTGATAAYNEANLAVTDAATGLAQTRATARRAREEYIRMVGERRAAREVEDAARADARIVAQDEAARALAARRRATAETNRAARVQAQANRAARLAHARAVKAARRAGTPEPVFTPPVAPVATPTAAVADDVLLATDDVEDYVLRVDDVDEVLPVVDGGLDEASLIAAPRLSTSTVDSTLTSISEAGGFFAPLARRLQAVLGSGAKSGEVRSLVDDIPNAVEGGVAVRTAQTANDPYGAVYLAGSVGEDPHFRDLVVLHEIIHQGTVDKIVRAAEEVGIGTAGANGVSISNAAALLTSKNKPVARLAELYIWAHAKFLDGTLANVEGMQYGMNSLEEFVAMGMGSTRVSEEFAKLIYRGSNVHKTLLERVKSLLGIGKKESSLFDELFEAGENVMRSPEAPFVELGGTLRANFLTTTGMAQMQTAVPRLTGTDTLGRAQILFNQSAVVMAVANPVARLAAMLAFNARRAMATTAGVNVAQGQTILERGTFEMVGDLAQGLTSYRNGFTRFALNRARGDRLGMMDGLRAGFGRGSRARRTAFDTAVAEQVRTGLFTHANDGVNDTARMFRQIMSDIHTRAHNAGIRGFTNSAISNYMPRLYRWDRIARLGSTVDGRRSLIGLFEGALGGGRGTRQIVDELGNHFDIPDVPAASVVLADRLIALSRNSDLAPVLDIDHELSLALDNILAPMAAAGVSRTPHGRPRIILDELADFATAADHLGHGRNGVSIADITLSDMPSVLKKYTVSVQGAINESRLITAMNEQFAHYAILDNAGNPLEVRTIEELYSTINRLGHVGADMGGSMDNHAEAALREIMAGVRYEPLHRSSQEMGSLGRWGDSLLGVALPLGYLSTGGAFGLVAGAETSRIVGTLGLRTTLKQVPVLFEMASNWRNMDEGHRNLAMMVDGAFHPSTDRLRRVLMQQVQNQYGNEGGAIRGALTAVSNVFSDITLLAPVTSMTQHLMAASTLQHFYDVSRNLARRMDDTTIRTLGLEPAQYDELLDYVGTNAVTRNRFGFDRVVDLTDLHDIRMDNLRAFIDRAVRTRIQDMPTRGDFHKLGFSVFGRLVTQFRGFNLKGVDNFALQNISRIRRGDAAGRARVAKELAVTMAFASLVQYSRHYVDARDQRALGNRVAARKLEKEFLGVSGYVRGGLSGPSEFFLPMMAVDATWTSAVDDDPIFSAYRYSGLNWYGFPAQSFISKGLSVAEDVYGAAVAKPLGLGAKERDITSSTIHKMRLMTPFQNFWGLKQFFNLSEQAIKRQYRLRDKQPRRSSGD